MEISEAFWRVISQASEDKPDQKQCHSIHPINSDVEKNSGNKTVGMPDFSWCTPHPCREVQNIFFFWGEVPRWWAIFSDALKPHQLDRFSRATSRYLYSRECWILACTVFAMSMLLCPFAGRRRVDFNANKTMDIEEFLRLMRLISNG